MKNIKALAAIQKYFRAVQHPANKNTGLANPFTRAEIPADFPDATSPFSAAKTLALIEAQLEKRGTTLNEVARINIAYPHKHPALYPNHHNSAEEKAQTLQKQLQELAPHIEWVMAQQLVERKHLGRSENQSSVYALTAKQEYDIFPPAPAFPFAEKNRSTKEYFIIVDNSIVQGTTVANLMSFIAANNGEVLMVRGDHSAPIAQKRTAQLPDLGPVFNDAYRNTGRLPEMAAAFAASAKRQGLEWTPREAILKFDAALQAHGNSVFALTDGEAERIINTVAGKLVASESFPDMLQKLEKLGKGRAASSKKALQPRVI